MADFDDIKGRIGDTSGRIGDTSGRIGDTSGRIGDTSGRTLEEVQRDIVRGRLIEKINFLESKVDRIEGDMVRLATMLDARLRVLEDRILASQIEDLVSNRLKDIEDQVQRVEDKVNAIPGGAKT
jgi:hypothetical protein